MRAPDTVCMHQMYSHIEGYLMTTTWNARLLSVWACDEFRLGNTDCFLSLVTEASQ